LIPPGLAVLETVADDPVFRPPIGPLPAAADAVPCRPAQLIGYLILVHRFPEQFKRLFQSIHAPENHHLVHVDANSDPEIEADIKDFLNSFPNAQTLEGKGALWGGYSLVEAELRGMERLLEMGGWDFFVNLSGQDFPLKSQAEIFGFLSANRGSEFIRVSDQRIVRPDTMARIENYTVELSDRLVDTGERRRFLPGMTPYIGNQWMVVSRKFCEFVCHDTKAEAFKDFYRNTFIADEGFFQTVMMNGAPHGNIVNDDLRMIDWIPDGVIKLRPRTYGMADAPELTASDALFARKFDMKVDEDILDYLERKIGSFEANPLPDIRIDYTKLEVA
jgi:hypothetical protein